MNKIEVIGLNKKFKREEKEIKKNLTGALKKLKRDGLYIEVYLVNNAAMKKINKIFRRKSKVTNVLSFSSKSFPRPDLPLKVLGEIYLAPDYIRARQENLKELARHGLLHLLGYTHAKKGDRMRMKKIEAWLIS